MDDGPLVPAPGPAAPGVVVGGEVADGELATVGPAEGPAMLRTAGLEAALAAVGAGRAEEGAGGLDDPHDVECSGEQAPVSPAGCQWGVSRERLVHWPVSLLSRTPSGVRNCRFALGHRRPERTHRRR